MMSEPSVTVKHAHTCFLVWLSGLQPGIFFCHGY